MERRKRYERILAWMPAVFMAAAIFWFSAQPAEASTDMSDGVSRLFLWLGYRLGALDGPPEQYIELIGWMSYPVRKCAHVTEYLVFYLTLLLGLWKDGRLSWEKIFQAAMAGTFLYACTDEFHQLFVPGRAGQVTDVLIDSSGAFLLTLALLWKRKRRRPKG